MVRSEAGAGLDVKGTFCGTRATLRFFPLPFLRKFSTQIRGVVVRVVEQVKRLTHE